MAFPWNEYVQYFYEIAIDLFFIFERYFEFFFIVNLDS